MARTRNAENMGLPQRWRLTRGAYYYQVPEDQRAKWDGKAQFRLGTTLAEAYKVYAERVGPMQDAKTVGQLLDRYALEVIPRKAVLTQVENRRAVRKLRAVFGAMHIGAMRPKLVYQYADRSKAKPQARKEIRTLSHAYTKAVEWGLLDRHPFKGEVRLEGEPPRTRYVEDWELNECLALPAKRSKGSVLMIQAYLLLKLLTGLRRGDLLRLMLDDLREDGIHVFPKKTAHTTGKRIIIEWSPALKDAVEMAKKSRTGSGDYLFCNRMGECYFDEEKGTASGWDSMWNRFMERVLAETKVKIRFTEHDIRAKSASDAETLEHAQKLLTHADSKITDKVYRRKPERVKPLR